MTQQLAIPRDQLPEVSRKLESESPQQILRWAVENYYPKLTMATKFGPEGSAILHMLSEIEPRVHVFNLDTGYQFQETLELRDRLAERLGIEVELVKPELPVPEYEAKHGGPLYQREPDRCCHDRKIVPLRQHLVGFEAWISSIRREQTPHRASASILAWDAKFDVVKVSPLANWTKKDVWGYVLEHQIPYNPMHDRGYPSVGCWPCTRAVADGDDERSGRWAGFNKTECGIHLGPSDASDA